VAGGVCPSPTPEKPRGEGSPFLDLGTMGGKEADIIAVLSTLRFGNTGSIHGCRDSNAGLLLLIEPEKLGGRDGGNLGGTGGGEDDSLGGSGGPDPRGFGGSGGGLPTAVSGCCCCCCEDRDATLDVDDDIDVLVDIGPAGNITGILIGSSLPAVAHTDSSRGDD